MVKPLIDAKVQIGVYKKYKDKIFQENGKAHKCKHQIYNKLTKKLKGMSAKSIQTSINRNVKKILEDDVNEVTNGNNAANYSSPEDNAESTTATCGDNGSTQYVPLEFVQVVMEEVDEDNAEVDSRSSSPLSNSYDLEDIRFEADRLNESLVKLYNKRTVQEDVEGVKQVHKNIDNLVNIYKNEIANLNESHRHISCSFQNNLKNAEEEINRLSQKDVASMKTIDNANTKIFELEKKLSNDRKEFDEEISRLSQKDVALETPLEAGKSRIESNPEIRKRSRFGTMMKQEKRILRSRK